MDPWEKSETVDPEVRAHVYSLVNAVGGSSTIDDTYAVGDDALAVLNDIVRWIRLYDEKLRRDDVKRCLAEANVVKGDLVEILALWAEDQTDNKHRARLALACVQLLVPLTWPFDYDEDKFTVNNHRHLPYLQLAHVSYKRTILGYEHAKMLRTAARVGLPSMVIPRRDRTRRDEGVIKLVLYLFRNIAQITQPDHLPSQGDENDVSRPALIKAFHDQDIFPLLLTVGSGALDEFVEQDVILLEIIFHLLKGIDPEKVFLREDQITKQETNELQMLIQKEKAMLNGYNKHGPSRHHRFGTMLWVKRGDEKVSTVTGQHAIADESTTLKQLDANKKWNKPKYRGKAMAGFDEQSDFLSRVDLDESSRTLVRSFVEDFLDSSFNPLFTSLRKAIASENDRVSPMHIRQYFYLIHWLLDAERARRKQKSSDQSSTGPNSVPHAPFENVFTYIAAVLDQETFVLLNRSMQKAFDEKDWQTLHTTLLCLTEILLTVQSMTESQDEEDQEIAENIQSRIFYEESTHDRLVQILRGCAHQGFSYLDGITHCVHVFVRLLERYSKQNVDLMIRSKRRARRKKGAPEGNTDRGTDGQDDTEDIAEDTREAHAAVSERKFDFARFSAKFLAQGCVDTFVSFVRFYRELSPEQLKRCHRYFYRLVVKHDLGILLFRVDVLQLFHKMIKGPDGLDSEFGDFDEWQTLVQHLFRRCIKWIDRPTDTPGWSGIAIVEMLFSKVPNTLFYLQNGYERVVEKRAPRPPAELDFKAQVAEGERIAVAVSLLIDQTKSDAINWVRSQLQKSIIERQSWEEERLARAQILSESPDIISDEQSGTAPSIFVTPDSDERRTQLFKDKQLRLLLTTLGLERLGSPEDMDAAWIIPPNLSSEQLQSTLDQLNKAEFDPPRFEDGKSAEDLVRNKSATRPGANQYSDVETDDGNSSGGDIDEAMFPPNLREARKDGAAKPKKRRLKQRQSKELTEEEVQARAKARKLKERERNSKIKSQLYVTAEDDESDEEADAEFFRLEEERRHRTAGQIREAMLNAANESGSDSPAKSRKRKSSGKTQERPAKQKKTVQSDDESDGADHLSSSDEDSDGDGATSRVRPINFNRSTESESEGTDDDDDDVFMRDEESDVDKSATASPLKTRRAEAAALREVSGNASNVVNGNQGLNTEDGDEDEPVTKPLGRRNVRAGFIIDDSDDE